MPFRVKVEIKNFRDLERRIKKVGETLARETNAAALRKAAKPGLRAARANAAEFRDSGALQKSLGVRLYKNKRRRTVTAYIGPRVGFAATDSSGRKRDPIRYAHILELGRDTYRPIAAKHFLRRAFNDTKKKAFDIWKSELQVQFPRVVRRHSKRSSLVRRI